MRIKPKTSFLANHSNIFFCCVLILLANLQICFSQSNVLKPNTLSTKADYVVIIDNSGSIKLPEHQELMRQATKAFISVLEEEDKLTLMTFDSRARVIFSEVLPNSKSAERQNFEAKVNESSLNFRGKETNITAAFEMVRDNEGFWREKDISGSTIPKIVILISDGALDVNNPTRIATLYQRMMNMKGKDFQDININCFEINNPDAGKKIGNLDITGSELLRRLAGESNFNQYKRLEELVDVIESYIEVIRDEKKITQFTSPQTPTDVGSFVTEVKLILFKKDKKLQPVKSTDYKLKVDDKIIAYSNKLEKGITYNDLGVFLLWESKDGYDVITIERLKKSELSKEEIQNFAKTLSVDMESDLGLSIIENVHVLAAKTIGYDQFVEKDRPYLLNHDDTIKVFVYERALGAEKNAKLKDLKVKGQVKKDTQKDWREYNFQSDLSDSSFVIPLNSIKEAETGLYEIAFTAIANNASGDNTIRRPRRYFSFKIDEDYLFPTHTDLGQVSDFKPSTIGLELRVDKSSKYFTEKFDLLTSLIVEGVILKNNKKVASYGLEQVGQDESGRYAIYRPSSTKSIEIRDTGIYQVYYEIKGVESATGKNISEKTSIFHLATITPSPIWRIVKWGSILVVISLMVLSIRIIQTLSMPRFGLTLTPIGDARAKVRVIKRRARRRHSVTVNFEDKRYRISLYSAQKDKLGRVESCIVRGQKGRKFLKEIKSKDTLEVGRNGKLSFRIYLH